MPVTAGEFREWLDKLPADTPIVIDVNTDEGIHLYVDEFDYTTDEGLSGSPSIQVEITWTPDPGWVQRLIVSANETRAQLGMPPLP
jgi:hypothetical protein